MNQNKQTIKYKEVDGFNIIIGFDQLPTDTAASLINAESKIKELPEFKELLAKSKQKEEHFRKSAKAKGMAKLALIGKADADKSNDTGLSKKLQVEYLKQDKEYKDQSGAAGACNTELIEINLRLEPIVREVRRQNLVYSEARRDEATGTDEWIAELFEEFWAKTDNEQISLILDETGKITGYDMIPDFRGCQYSFKDKEGIWNEEPIITALNRTVNTVVVDDYQDQAIERADLTPEQVEEIRFQWLDTEGKALEYEQKKTGIAIQAASMETGLKFDGDPDYQTKAQTWYDSELVTLKTLYGVK